MDAINIMQTVSDKNELGWNKDSFFSIMLQFIEEQGHPARFGIFVGRKAAEEKIASEENIRL